MVSKVKSKLSGWKAKQLSFAGIVTLSKSVIEAIPIYRMMTTMLPSSCIQEIQKLQRSFILGDTEDEKSSFCWLGLFDNTQTVWWIGPKEFDSYEQSMSNEMGLEMRTKGNKTL